MAAVSVRHHPLNRADVLDSVFESIPLDSNGFRCVSKLWNDRSKKFLTSPRKIKTGLYGAKIIKNGKTAFVFMELLTKKNAKAWSHFLDLSEQMTRGMFYCHLRDAHHDYPFTQQREALTGFTLDEFNSMTEKMIALKQKTNDQIVETLRVVQAGLGNLTTFQTKGHLDFITYVTNKPHFSITTTINTGNTVKDFFNAYSDVFITVGSRITCNAISYWNNGISRNPALLIEEQHSGYSMPVHEMTGAVVEKYYQEIPDMTVRPLGSMQCILQKKVQRGDAYIIVDGKPKDIKDFEFSMKDGEGPKNVVRVPALTRGFYEEAIRYEE